jgi:spermidine synthase
LPVLATACGRRRDGIKEITAVAEALNATEDKPYSTWYLSLVAFCSGMAVMGVEMGSSRLLAPYFGTSISIWTVIIGSTMIALTMGYYLGGILADRNPRLSFITALLTVAAAAVVFLPYVVQPVMDTTLDRFASGSAMTSAPDGAAKSYGIIAALLLCAGLISAPVVVLGMTSPFLIRLASMRSTAVGHVAGRVFAFSTLGSILGTFLPALVLIPRVGTRFSFLLFGGLLLAVTVWSTGRFRTLLLAVSALVLFLGFQLGSQTSGPRQGRYLVHEKETIYQLVRIFRLPLADVGAQSSLQGTILLTDAGFGIQSMWVEGQPQTDSWQDSFALVPRIYEACNNGAAPRRILLLGLGGGCAPYVISQSYPDAIIDGVELDSGLIEAAKPYFPYEKSPNLTIHVADARFFLRTRPQQYDVIIVDVFRPPHIPVHVATAEFFGEIRRKLLPGGILAMNVACRDENRVCNDIANTVADAFPHVYFSRYISPDASGIFTNHLYVASADDLALDRPEREEAVFASPNPAWKEVFEKMRDPQGYEKGQRSFFRQRGFDPAGTVFSDDRSALDMVVEREFLGVILGKLK